MKLLWVTIGLVSVALGLVGIVLPLLPTVPFLLLAAFCFGRSSDHLHDWLVSHPRFGALILDWQERGAISLRGKRLATVSVAAVFAISLALGVRPTILVIQAAALTGVLIFIWTRPS